MARFDRNDWHGQTEISNRFEIIYNRAELYETLNKREVLGKHYKQIEKDAEYFKELMAKAEGLRQRLKQIKK